MYEYAKNVLAQKPVDSEYVYLTIHAYQYMMHLILHCILDNLLDSFTCLGVLCKAEYRSKRDREHLYYLSLVLIERSITFEYTRISGV